MKWPDDLKESLEPSYGAPGRKFVGVAYEEPKMNTLLKVQEQEERNKMIDKKPNLVLIAGGGDAPDENWLSGIDVGVVFLARHTGQDINNPILEMFQVMSKTEDGLCACLVANEHMTQPSEKKMTMYVDTLRFSRQYRHQTDLGRVTNG